MFREIGCVEPCQFLLFSNLTASCLLISAGNSILAMIFEIKALQSLLFEENQMQIDQSFKTTKNERNMSDCVSFFEIWVSR
jgi:hypothetical protein